MTRKKLSQRQLAEAKFRKDQFNQLLTIWLAADPNPGETKRTLSSFAAQLNPPRTQGEISRWRSDKYPTYKPEDYDLDSICEVLGIENKSIFYLNKETEYEYDPNTVNNYIKQEYGYLIDEEHIYSIRRLLQFIKSVSLLEKNFPLWTKIVPIQSQKESIKKEIESLKKTNDYRADYLEEDVKKDYGYMRALYNTLPSAAPSEYPEFQIQTDHDGIKTLQEEDLAFIADVEQKIIKYLLTLFTEHSNSLAESAERADIAAVDRSIKHTGKDDYYNYYPDADIYEDAPPGNECHELSDEEMILLDPYYKESYQGKRYKTIYKKKGDEK